MNKYITILLLALTTSLFGQRIPNESENIKYMITFGKQSERAWGDDDFSQTLFFMVPTYYTKPFYIRVFDPDCGGEIDEVKGTFDSKTKIDIYGGKGAHSSKDAHGLNPVGTYRSGNLLGSRIFGVDPKTDNNWYTFGPFKPQDGERVSQLGGNIFKVIIEGVKGDDGNLYYFYLSSSPTSNKSIEGANGFCYEYSFRLPEDPHTVTHIYPFVDKNVVSLTQSNFDFDLDGEILLYSVSKNRHKVAMSNDNEWKKSKHIIDQAEKNTTVDFQIIKKNSKHNDMVFSVVNQYNSNVSFFSIPIGGPPKYKYKVDINVRSQ